MNKKVTIFAVILIAIGIIGTISSSIYAVPFVTNYVNESYKKANEEVKIYEKKTDINKLNIETKNVNVEVRKSDSDKITIKQMGRLSNKSFSIDDNNKEFTIKENDRNQNIDIKIKDFDDLLLNMMNRGYNKIIVSVPNGVDIQTKTNGGDLMIQDKSVLFNKLECSTLYGRIFIPTEGKNLESLRISSHSTVDLTVGELLGIKNIDIITETDVYVKSMPDDIFVDNIENLIPESLNITSSTDEPNVYIKSNIPVAKNLNIDNKLGKVNLDLPTNRYNIYFNLNALKGLRFKDEDSDDKKTTNKFEGSFREPKANEFKYNVYVKSDKIKLVKK